MLRQTYDFKGSEIDLLARGLISAGWLDGLKARLLAYAAVNGGCRRRGNPRGIQRLARSFTYALNVLPQNFFHQGVRPPRPTMSTPVMSETSWVSARKVVGVEVAHPVLAAGAGEELDLHGERVEVVGHAVGRLVHVEALHQLGQLGLVMPTGQRPVWQCWHS